MTPERWRQIEELYHSAREHGPTVLADAEPELRREVERLLAQDMGDKILDRPAAALLQEFNSVLAHDRSASGEPSDHSVLEKIRGRLE